MRLMIATAIILLIAEVGRSGERIIDHWITETTLFRGSVLPASEFSETRVKNLATRLFAASGRRVVLFRVVPEGPDVGRGALALTDVDPFRLWRDQYDWMVDYTRPVARATLIDGNAVLQYRDRRGKESRIVLTGSDPLLFWRGGIQFEIVAIHRQGREAGVYDIELLVKTDIAVSEEAARRLTEEYKARLGVPRLTLVFRTDCWFVGESFYPTFKGCGMPPSEEEFRRATSLRCDSTRQREVRCSAQ